MPFWPKSPVILSKGRCRVILAQRNFDLVARFTLRISMPFMFPFILCPRGLCVADAMASPSAACSSPSSQNGEILRGALCNLQGLLAGGGWRWWCAALLQLRAPNVHMGTETQAGEVRSSLQRFLNFSSGVAQSWLKCCRPVLPWLSRGAAHLLRLGAWARLSLIACVFSWHPHACFLFGSSIQDANGRWFLFFGFKTSLEPFSRAARSASQTSQLPQLPFMKPKTSQTRFDFA